jgi:hypothetical protein
LPLAIAAMAHQREQRFPAAFITDRATQAPAGSDRHVEASSIRPAMI